MKVKITKVGNPLAGVIPFRNLISGSDQSPNMVNSNVVGTDDDDITTHIKTVDREDSNLEAEKGELILKPGLDGLYKIGGKKHTRGGTPLYAEGGSFIFSDDKRLKITREEKEQFNFKKSGGKRDKHNTPARVLQREVDPKEFNRLMSVVLDPNKDSIAKKSASLMIEKYQEKIGQVAFLQELKKQFPDGMPEFAKDTAPVVDEDLSERKHVSESFGRGGRTNGGNPLEDLSSNRYGVPYNKLNFMQKLEIDGMHRQSVGQQVDSANRYEPSNAVRRTKGAIAGASAILPSPFKQYANYVGVGGDLATSLNYARDGQWGKAAEDLGQAALGFMPYGKVRKAQSADGWVNAGGEYNKLLRAGKMGSDGKTMQEAFGYGGKYGLAGEVTTKGTYGVETFDKEGRHIGDKNKSKNIRTGKVSSTWNGMTKYKSIKEYADAVGYTGTIDVSSDAAIRATSLAIQRDVMKKHPDLVSKFHGTKEGYGENRAKKPDDGMLGVRWEAIGEEIQKQKVPKPEDKPVPDTTLPTPPEVLEPKKPTHPSIPWEGFDFKMNALEKLTVAAPGLDALSAKSYYDMLSQVHTPNIRLDRMDGQQEINDTKEMGTLATREAFANSAAGVASRIVSSVRANSLKNISGVNNRVNQMNTQIGNQEAMTNYNSMVRDMGYNVENVHKTFNNNQLTQQRAGEARRAGFAQSLNNANAIQGNLDNLSQGATMAALPYITNAKDENGEEMLFKGEDGVERTMQGVPFGFNQRRMPRFNPMFAGLDSMGVQMAGRTTGMQDIRKDEEALYRAAVKAGDVDKMAKISKSIWGTTKGAAATTTPKTALQGFSDNFLNFMKNP